ncbi:MULTISPECIES: type II secretion system F family protein [Pseudorhizobium]|uniref:Pilus assembly protein n=1 Tax=Pseudorhizobium pelagicum TaxID=1509405 RepID=A0A922T9W8_9HYPH|nr:MULTISPECIES: type II secretion system F family protein [Pseudorhizobium]MBA4784695.1 type II secretion system F family protein [Hyphomicrobiales bacterium]MBU1313565.1 type II secretion system F family protein [Alphaproteobacteria bacterium]MDY6960702.1 type II secretion system F family protein [Pseudomonadota bacterium]KEQ03519.1 pilus assembly protein [Pseudorhizobium pelagicum]KEQ03862.1 pilus assembly protein [Pseudorhizobium pelagicum]|tara:strand:- start:2996 stop:4009 length:1014 start_codon:yes stop_codon:yes gene_type:complete
MFGLDANILLIVALVAVSAGAVSYALLFSRIETENKTSARISRVKSAESDLSKVKAARDRVQELSKRRKSVQDSLKDLEKKQEERSKKMGDGSLKSRLAQTGLPLTMPRFYMMSGALGVFALVAALLAGIPLIAAAGAAFVAVIGLPRWIVAFLVKRRQKQFLTEFPNALDVMVRSIKSGLPLNDALRLIAADGQEPVKAEFRRVVESQQVGLSIPEACVRMMQTMPLPEVNFFAIVITIQSQAGGNLSEALGNLAKVLRERKKMKAKVQALSMEAKASAVIIGALPFIVALLVYLTSPEYMTILFTDPRGHMIMLFSAIWMSIGIFVMRNMINFDF